jgi:putative inorganic carbon (HCO3(-)) transporter
MFKEVKEISTGNLNESYGTNRVHIWKETIKVVPKNIYFGVGIDNFLNAFGDEPLKSERGRMIDKAHNEYLQILITEGIFTLIAYLIFLISICLKGLKMNSIYLIPVFGYLVQAFFNISVIEVAPLLYILMGFIAKKAKVK